MRFASHLVGYSLCAWLGVALAQQSIGTWTISHVHRTRSTDNMTCNWTFTIEASEIKNARPPANCTFAVQGTNELGCDKRDLGDVSCTDGVTQYSIGGGWSNQGFVVISVVNPDENAQAYFGYSDHALNSGTDLPAQEKDALLIGTVEAMAESKRFVQRDGHHDALLLIENATAWKVSNLRRGVFCGLNISGPPNTNLATWPWYDQNCEGSGWTVSMGYMTDGDAGIMTVVSPGRHREAFFGVRGINKANNLGSMGPNAVSDI